MKECAGVSEMKKRMKTARAWAIVDDKGRLVRDDGDVCVYGTKEAAEWAVCWPYDDEHVVRVEVRQVRR